MFGTMKILSIEQRIEMLLFQAVRVRMALIGERKKSYWKMGELLELFSTAEQKEDQGIVVK